MAGREAILETIYRAYDARGKGDIDGVMAAFHPNAVFQLSGDGEMLEVAGAAQGYENVRAAMTGMIENFEFVKREIVAEMVEGERAAIHSRVTIRYVPKNVTVTTDLLNSFKFANGKIIELVEFADTALIKNLLSP